MKPFLILQLRPNDEAADGEYFAFLKYGGLKEEDAHRIRMSKEGVPAVNLDDYSGVIVGGGSPCITDEDPEDYVKRFMKELEPLVKEVVEKDFPYLGACFGFNYMVDYTGGEIKKGAGCAEDIGAIDVTFTEEGQADPLLKGLPKTFKAFVGHKEGCYMLPEGGVHLASSPTCKNQMFRLKNNIYGTQFHPELDGEGMAIRIRVYKHAGYFPPEDADKLIDELKDLDIFAPMEILKRFVEKYKRG